MQRLAAQPPTREQYRAAVVPHAMPERLKLVGGKPVQEPSSIAHCSPAAKAPPCCDAALCLVLRLAEPPPAATSEKPVQSRPHACRVEPMRRPMHLHPPAATGCANPLAGELTPPKCQAPSPAHAKGAQEEPAQPHQNPDPASSQAWRGHRMARRYPAHRSRPPAALGCL